MISIVFPAYNESKRIHLLKRGLKNYQNPHQLISEIILVDDGSTDDTLKHLKEIQKEFKRYAVKVIEVRPNQGKGNAIKAGVLAASQSWVLCNDADLSYSMDQIDQWKDQFQLNLNQKNTVYFGSRELGKKNNEMELFLHRIIIGRIYSLFIRLITGITVKDTQCGYKLYSEDVVKKIFPHVQEKRFAFDVEVHYLLKKEKVNINLLPVKCIDIEGSKVNLIRDSWQMFRALFRIVKRS
jgi:dolichyl-phosphate beta-glucosyltransferase